MDAVVVLITSLRKQVASLAREACEESFVWGQASHFAHSLHAQAQARLDLELDIRYLHIKKNELWRGDEFIATLED